MAIGASFSTRSGIGAEGGGIILSKSTKLSESSSQNRSNASSGCFLSLLPAIIAAFMPPIDVPAIISNLILLFAIALILRSQMPPKIRRPEGPTRSQLCHYFWQLDCHYCDYLYSVLMVRIRASSYFSFLHFAI